MSWQRATSKKAHYVLSDGSTACARRFGPRGIVMGELFDRKWSPMREDDHLCTWCRIDYPARCQCGVCRVIPRPAP